MKEYSPKRRTALVLTGSGTSGAYHAGALRALDESGVKVDLVVGTGVGTVAAAFGAVAGGAKLYGPGAFWDRARWASFYRLRLALRTALLLLGSSFSVFLLPLAVALVAGLLFPLVLIVDIVRPGLPSQLIGNPWATPAVLREPYLATLAAPVFALSALAIVALVRALARDPRRFAENFESLLDAERARDRLARGLWEIARGPAISQKPPAEAELGRRYVALAAENLGQPGFRELILRVADLETGGPVLFVLLEDAHRESFTAAPGRSRSGGRPVAVDLRAPGCGALLFDAVVAGLLPPLVAPVRRVLFPRGGVFAGETHRLTDATLVGGSGIAEAVAAGAEQVIVVSATPETPSLPLRRRGPHALADGILASLERQAVEQGVRTTQRINRMVETLGHRTQDGGRAWQDPATGRLYRDIALYVVRPERRVLGPLELDGARDPATDVEATLADLVDEGHRDICRHFVEPVVGAVTEPRRSTSVETEEPQAVEL